MKCAVAIVLALIGMSLAHPAPSGLGGLAYSSLLSPAVEYRSSFINHGVPLPRIKPIIVHPIKPIIEPVIKVPIIKVPIVAPIIKPIYGLGHGLH